MLKQVFKLYPYQYEKFYQGELVTSTDELTTLQLNVETLAVTINGSTVIDKNQYIVEISNRYLEPTAVEDLFTADEIDSIATAQEIRDLFN